MSQNIFKNPFVVGSPILTGVGNGTLTVNKLTHFTITQQYTAICTAVAPFTVFTIIGSLDGPVGVATVGTQFVDQDLKIFLTINQGPVLFSIGDQFTLDVNQGTDLNQQNIDTYDELPQKNFSSGILGQNAGDDNFRFKNISMVAQATIQDLEFTSLLSDELGNGILLEYYNTTIAQKAQLILQDLTFDADVAGLLGNNISIEYENFDPAVKAFLTIQDLLWIAVTPGAAGNNIQIEYTTGGTAGFEVVTVTPGPTTLIQIQIESGVSTVNDIRYAVAGTLAAAALIVGYPYGTGLETQTAPFAATNLAGGSDSVGSAGFEVVSVVGDAIKVKFESGVSTATQIKTAIDAYGPAAALVDVTISGTGSNPQAAPQIPTNLSGGTDSVGAPGFEVVTVSGTHIRVGFQTGVNTAQNIKDAIDGFPAAAALVSIAITGVASDPQSAPASQYLSHGQRSDSWYLNINEITNPSQFYDGNGNLCVNFLLSHAGLFVRNLARFRGVVTLDDILSDDNLSGPAIPNLQSAVNKLFKDKNIFIGTEDNSKVRWNAPNLYFTSPLVIRFEDTNVFNRILTSFSPLNIPDGYSVYVTVNRQSTVNLTPTIAATIPVGEDVIRVCSRVGSYVVFYDNTIIGENQVVRIGAAIDLSAQIFTVVDMTGQFIYDPSIAGKMSWNSQIKIKPLGSSAIVTIFANDITLADDEVAYIELDDPIVTANKVVLKAARSNVLMNRPDVFWLFHRSGSKIYLRFGGEMEPGEERNIGDTISDDIYTVLDMANETDASLSYTTILGGPVVANNYVVNGEGLQKSVKRLDTRLGSLSSISNQDRNLKIIEGGTWGWEISGANKLEWSVDAYIQVPGLSLVRNTILAGNVILASGEVAYVVINRTGGGASNLTVNVSAIASLVLTDDIVVIARRVSTGVIVGTHSFLLKTNERLEIDGALAEINRYFASLRFKKHPTDGNRVIISASDVTLLDSSKIGQFLEERMLSFDGAVMDFSTGNIYEPDEITPLATNFTPVVLGTNHYAWYGISLLFDATLANGQSSVTIVVNPGSSSNAVLDSANHPAMTGDRPLGWIWVRENGAGGLVAITEANFVRLAGGAGGGGGKIEVLDEGISVGTGIKKIDFVGGGVLATLAAPDRVTVTVSSGGGSKLLKTASGFGDGVDVQDCTISTVSSKTRMTLTSWSYTGNFNTGKVRGDIFALVNGQEVQRLVTGFNDNEGNILYTEPDVLGNKIDFYRIVAGSPTPLAANDLIEVYYIEFGQSASSSSIPVKFEWNNAVSPIDTISGPHYQNTQQILTAVLISMLNSGTSGSTTIRLNVYRAGAFLTSATASIPHNSGNPHSVIAALSGSLSLNIADVITCDIVSSSGGAPERISVEYIEVVPGVVSTLAELRALYKFVIGSPTDVLNGLATHSTFASAQAAASNDDRVSWLKGTFSENIIVTKPLKLDGLGHGTVLNGTITFSNTSSYSSLKDLKVTGNVTADSGSNGIFVKDIWLSTGSTIVDNGTGNLMEAIVE